MLLAEPERTRADIKWRMLGIPVRVHPYFWVGCVVLGWSVSRISMDLLLVWVAVVFFSTLIHELGHALTARRFGSRSVRIVLYSFGGLAIHEGVARRWERILISFMGPGAELLLALGVWLLAKLVGVEKFSSLVSFGYVSLLYVCVAWALLNLIPVFPLDGGQILLELCRARRPHDGILVGLKLSLGVAIVMMLVATAAYVAGWPLGDQFVIALFAVLALSNWLTMRQLAAQGYGGGGDDRMAHEREPWESDPDAWKR